MTTPHSILVATDLSAPARHAAERAALISQHHARPLCLLHVANTAPLARLSQLMTVTQDSMTQKVLAAAQSRLHELAELIQKKYGVNSATRVVAGALLPELQRTADDLTASLLVCGARGESLLRHMLLGSTAERVLRSTTRPVLVVKQAPHEPYKSILVPVDFSASSLRAIRQAQTMAPAAQLVLLHVFEVPFEGHLRYASVGDDTINHYRVVAMQDATQRLHALSQQAGLSTLNTRLIVLQGDPALRILEQEQEQDCDLIVIGKHGESMLEELLLGSVTRHVLVESQGDVLVSV